MSNHEPLSSKQAEFNTFIETRIENIKEKYSINEIILNKEIEDIYDCLFDEILFGFSLQIHREAKLGFLFYFDSNDETTNDYSGENEANSVSGTEEEDIFTINNSRNNLSKYECKCPNCNRAIAAIRFAPHLEKCMGLGRSSSRMATRRIQSYNFDEYDHYFEEELISQNSLSSSSSNNLLDLASSTAPVATTNTSSGLKPPTKRKRMQASTSMQTLSFNK
jgi:hypothetical protein